MGGNGPGLLVVCSESQFLAVRGLSARCRSSKVLNGSATNVIMFAPHHHTHVSGEAVQTPIALCGRSIWDAIEHRQGETTRTCSDAGHRTFQLQRSP